MFALVVSMIALGLPQDLGSDPAGTEITTDEITRVLAEAESALERATAAQEAKDLGEARAQADRVVALLAPLPLGKGHDDTADILWRVGGVAYSTGNLGGAHEAWIRVLDHRERTLPADHADLLMARANLAVATKRMGDLPGARALFEAVLEARERTLPADHPHLIAGRRNLAATMYAMGDPPGARALFEAVLEARERTLPADHPALLADRLNLAATMTSMGDLAGARALEEAVLEARERTLPADHPHLLGARFNLATTMRRMGDLAGARALYEAVLEARERTLPADHPDLLVARGRLAATMYLMGDLPGARALGVDLARGMLRRLELASVLSPREAIEAVGSEAYRHSLTRFLTEPKGSDEAAPIRFDLAETMRAIASVSGGTTGEDSRRRKISTLRARLSDLVSGGPGEEQSSETFAAEVSKLTFARDRFERAIRGDLATKGVFAGAIRTADVAMALPEGAAAVGFLRHMKPVLDPVSSKVQSTSDVLAAHILLEDGSLTEVELGAADELEELARAWRASLGKPLSGVSRGAFGERVQRGVVVDVGEVGSEGKVERERKAGEELRAHILDPILAGLGKEVTTLHVCLDDFLYLLPIDALSLGPDEGDGRVRDRYQIVNEVSFARLLSKHPPTRGEDALLAMGGVKFDLDESKNPSDGRAGTFTVLPETRVEAEGVGHLFEQSFGEPASLLMEEKATKEAFHEQAPGKRYLHVATHGWFAPETILSTLDARDDDDALWSRTGAREAVTGLAPMTLCGLAFAGANQGRNSLGRVPGIMTAEELAGIDLSACELAVLSACETNVGIRRAGQGIQSLQAALHAAGVRTAITSLWKVDDAMTRRLMELFYTYLWVEKMPKAEALWRAKCDLRREGAAVRDWAGWVLSGDPR